MATGFYNAAERETLRQAMDEVEPWRGAREDDPRPADPNAITIARHVVTIGVPGPFADLVFPLGAAHLRLGEAHEDDRSQARDRRGARCPFAFAHATTGRDATAIAWTLLIGQIRMSPDRPLRDVWRSVRRVEIFEMRLDGVRWAQRQAHPGLRGGLEDLRIGLSHDPELGPLEHEDSAGPVSALGTLPVAGPGMSTTGWQVVRMACAEQNASMIYVPLPFAVPGADLVLAVHPLATLTEAGHVVFEQKDRIGSLVSPWQLLRYRDDTHGGGSVARSQILPSLVYLTRRALNRFKRAMTGPKAFVSRCRQALPPSTQDLEAVAEWFAAWGSIFRNGRQTTRELSLWLLALLGLFSVVGLVAARVTGLI